MEKGAPLSRLPFIVIIWNTRQKMYFFLDPDPSHRDTSRCLCVQSIDNKNQKKLSALNKARALNDLDQDIKHEFLSRISKCKHIKILEHSYMTLYFKVTVIAWVVVVVDLYLSQQHFWTILWFVSAKIFPMKCFCNQWYHVPKMLSIILAISSCATETASKQHFVLVIEEKTMLYLTNLVT